MPEVARRTKAAKPAAPPSELRRVVRLLSRFSGGPRSYLVAIGLLIVEAVTSVFQPYPIAYLIDFFRSDRPPLDWVQVSWLSSPASQTLAILTAGIVLLTMVNSLADSLAEITLARGGRRLGYNARQALYQQMHRLSLAFHGHRRTGDMLTRVTSDVTALEEFVVDSMSDLLGSVLVLIGTLAFLFSQSWQVALVAVLIVPLLSVVSTYFSTRIKAASKRLRAHEGDLASMAQEMLSSIRVIQTYGRSAYEERRFADQSGQTVEAALEAASLKAKFSWVVAVLEALAISAVAWIGLWLIGSNTVTVGTLVLFIVLIQNMFKPTRKIIREWTLIGKIFASAERIAEVLDRQAGVRDDPSAVEAPALKGRLTFDDVSFAYQLEEEDAAGDDSPAKRVALRQVGFDVAPGQVLALVGASGAGKSTVAQLIPRLYDPDSGAVRIDGTDIREFTLESLRAQVSMVLQETVLFSGTVAENIAYGREDATLDDVVEAAVKANADQFIRELPEGYETILGERGANLSGGQRQRIAIARAFIRNSPILILDEPTTGLDALATEQVVRGLRTLMRGKTTVIVSHDLHLIRAADLIVVLEEGNIVQSGNHDRLIRVKGPYAEFCAKQGLLPPEPATVSSQVASHPEEVPGEDGRRHGWREAWSGRRRREPVPAGSRAAAPRPTGPRPERSGGSRSGRPGAERKDAAPVSGNGASIPSGGGGGAGGGPWPDDVDPVAGGAMNRFLPGLRPALDPQLMAAELQACLMGNGASGLSIDKCTPGKAMFLGREGVSLRYALRVRDVATGRTSEELVIGRVLPGPDEAEAYRQGLEPLVADLGGRPELESFARPYAMSKRVPGLVVHAFPLDHDLPTLVGATDRHRMVDVFSHLLRADYDVRDVSIDAGHYGRRHRCVLRYELEVATRTASVARSVVFGKVYAGDTGELVSEVIPAARRSLAAGSAAVMTLPTHLRYLPELHLTLLGRVAGKPTLAGALKELLSSDARNGEARGVVELVEDAGRVAASMHAWSIPVAPPRTLADDAAYLWEHLVEMERYSPMLASRLATALKAVEAGAGRTAEGYLCYSHGDYTHSQLLHEGRAVGLVDFDSSCRAEPALDLGHFLAYLKLGIAKYQTSPVSGAELARRLSRGFLESYAIAHERADMAELEARVRVFSALSLVRISVHAWLKLKPERVRLVLPLLDEGLKQLA